ncbi:hypothetical protein ACJX0J_022548, partial [Zea mays]
TTIFMNCCLYTDKALQTSENYPVTKTNCVWGLTTPQTAHNQAIQDVFAGMDGMNWWFTGVWSEDMMGALLALDISKAFDSISWPFLLDMLQHLGFGRICEEQVFLTNTSFEIQNIKNSTGTTIMGIM